MSALGGGHPEQLLWFAGGRLDRVSASIVERHLRSCEVCRAEVESLRSMFRSIRDDADAEHVECRRLVAYHDGDASLSSDERRFIEDHLAGCRSCAEELAVLGRVEASRRPRSVRRLLGAAASVLIVVAAGWGLSRWIPPTPPSPDLQRVVFAPAQRGLDGGPRIGADGPWEFKIWLPLLAPASRYVARIHRADDPGATIFEAVVAPAPEGAIVLLLGPGLFEPGHHVLSLTRRGGDGSEVFVNGFDVESRR